MLVSTAACPPASIADTLSGVGGIVDLWYWPYESATEAALEAAARPLLSDAERDRGRAFRFARDRRLFLATRILVRTTLSRYADVGPADWQFTADDGGKPRLATPTRPPLHFNLANTPGLVVCGVSVAHARIGVDVERIDRQVDVDGLAARYFSPAETAELRQLPHVDRARRFFSLWTLKESYVKARGLGLSLALDGCAFRLEDGRIRVQFDPASNDDDSRWAFAAIDVPSSSHLIAVAAETGGAPLSLRATAAVASELLERPYA